MSKKILAVALVLAIAVTCAFAANDGTMPKTLVEKFSYCLGYYTQNYFYVYQAYYYPEAQEYFGLLGMYDASTQNPLFTEAEMDKIIAEYQADYEARLTKAAKENLAEAESFLASNAKEKDITVTKSGLQYKVVKQGKGAYPKATDKVELDYKLTLLDGTVADSSYARGEHSVFGMNEVIKGFSEGVQLMPIGSHYIFYIHPDLAYGDANIGNIAPNSLLIFEVETYKISQ
ncbi:MAG: FKBP-type peptidyl-prolyl cis-trans isomerase [Sphaerochaetaceae bacterium]|nr:FKBP-type peptidyl-prolyl cis-trans isomerase [Sphaerochaetaceae bacterium]